MDLVLEGNARALTLVASGEIISESCHDLRQTVLECAARAPDSIVLDMQAVRFVDTSGIGVLVGLHEHLRAKNIGLRIVNPSTRVHQVLHMTRLLPLFGLPE